MSKKGYKQTAEHKQKIADAQRGKKRKPLSMEHKLHISQSNKGKTMSEEAKKAISLSLQGNQNCKGRVGNNGNSGFHLGHGKLGNSKGSTGKKWKYPWSKKKFTRNDATYLEIHRWVYKTLGKATKCEHCGIEATGRKMNWANKTQQYLKEISDWIQLCPSCHAYYDLNFQKSLT